MRHFNRRKFLNLSLGSAGTTLLSQCAMAQETPKRRQNSLIKNYTSTDGLLDVELEASLQQVNLGRQQAYLMTYNGQFPAPKLEVKPGDTVRIHFKNNLSQPSNIHYHGLHVPPTGNADNVFLSISPGDSFTYEFTLPKNHPAGTFWYHPHRHHYVAEQVFSGLAGLLIVRGELDQIPEIKAAQEEFLVLHDFDLGRNGQILAPNHHTQMLGREGSLITVNDQIQPTFSITKGGLMRLRFVNTSPSRFYRLSLENHPFYLIATDGGAISEPIELSELLLTPGQRAEVLIQGNREPGQYRLLNLPYNRGGMGMMGGGMMGRGRMRGGMMGRRGYDQTTETLANFVYQGSISPIPLPDKLIPVQPLPEPKNIRRIDLSMGMQPGSGMVFLFNGQVYDPQRIDQQVTLNTVEDWELINLDRDMMDHPIHLHINPFQIISRNGQPESYLAWKDTVLVRRGETVRIRTKFRDFSGKTVYHCHILDHEDLGMMGILNITT